MLVVGGLDAVPAVCGHVQLDVGAALEQRVDEADVVLVVLDVQQGVVHRVPFAGCCAGPWEVPGTGLLMLARSG